MRHEFAAKARAAQRFVSTKVQWRPSIVLHGPQTAEMLLLVRVDPPHRHRLGLRVRVDRDTDDAPLLG
ncbi:MAG: hypothetical protein AUJ92_02070 [Armatimonadetes bacterium CG2_30_59_28]|nr:MAG: hypothetical protein AUJ92_02070 [Armatimonadetes bacterium CG2_30_59_28]PIX42506.1 MAG: hypothetical protein COZ56_09230 [Armatimonadetes bacterium CG_4_8_14_3_um_filter_58_9]PIY47516.1 MAG: hypothetical protein COZ05_04795 [Armatimonadetes bacterium CG_4_10_14_3_um_filter_59_10]PJB62896.1 MAG: hypothetical protein CO095_17660 [Armatimonadetes bacterium CG_4_9_14_3_um_filter_58_7]